MDECTHIVGIFRSIVHEIVVVAITDIRASAAHVILKGNFLRRYVTLRFCQRHMSVTTTTVLTIEHQKGISHFVDLSSA